MHRRFTPNRFGNIGNNFRPAAEPARGGQHTANKQHGPPTNNMQHPSATNNLQAEQSYQQAVDQSAQMYEQAPAGQSSVELVKCEDVSMAEEENGDTCMEANGPPKWMKSKGAGGIVKVSKRERRRRQNVSLRRLLSPKNALMVLNEMLPGEQIANQFKVEVAQPTKVYSNQNLPNFCADLTFEQNTYKGYGVNKLAARNAAAEQAIRDLILKRMNGMEEGTDAEGLPMIQLASYALHKLFTEWEGDGHHVPQLRPNAASLAAAVQEEQAANAQAPPSTAATAAPATPRADRKPRLLPENAATMHPCTLLTFMRPGISYAEVGVEGDKPQNTTFTLAVQVDGNTYTGRANNKREARKQAAAAACTSLFGIVYQ